MTSVLLVDDDPDQLRLRQLHFEHSGFRVVTANSVDSATAAVTAAAPDVALMDLRLPTVEQGRGLIRSLHALSPGTRIVVLSGFPEDLEGLPESALVDHLLRKPVRSAHLLRTVARLACGA